MIVFGQSDHQKPLKTRRFRGFFFLPDHTFYPFDPRGATFLQLLILKYCIIFGLYVLCDIDEFLGFGLAHLVLA